MAKIDLLPCCEDVVVHSGDDCTEPAVAHVDAPEHGINEMFFCEQHFKEYLWVECKREAKANLASSSKGGRIKLRLRDLS